MCGCEYSDSNLRKEITFCHFCVARKTKHLQLKFYTLYIVGSSSAPFRILLHNFFKHINLIFYFLIPREQWCLGSKMTFR
jgi:hypothetical protein